MRRKGILVSPLLRVLVSAKVVPHSSGNLILTSSSGYLPNTLGSVAKGLAVAGSPTAVAVGGLLVTAVAGILVWRRINRRARDEE